MFDTEILCVVPARAGSKGIPGKNTIQLGGKPLLAWTIEAALRSGVASDVIVSTEDDGIAEIARAAGANVPFLRPAELAQDHVHAVHTVLHALDWHKQTKGYHPDAVMMLLPTSPLRSHEHIRAAVQTLVSSDAPAVIGVTDLGKHMTNLRYLDNGVLGIVAPEVSPNQQRQGVAPLYGVNGAMFLARSDLLIASQTFHMEGARACVMDSFSSLDINHPQDLATAKWLLTTGFPETSVAMDT